MGNLIIKSVKTLRLSLNAPLESPVCVNFLQRFPFLRAPELAMDATELLCSLCPLQCWYVEATTVPFVPVFQTS